MALNQINVNRAVPRVDSDEEVVMVLDKKQNEKINATDELLRERESTHGSFKNTAKISQAFKNIIRATYHSEKLSPVQREVLENISLKESRILSGNNWSKEHWVDIIGYAQLAIREIEEKEKESNANRF